MLLKQNCFIITDNELNALETGIYNEPKRIRKQGQNLLVESLPITYTGSSIQRKGKPQPKTEQKKTIEPIEHNLSSRSKTKILNKIIAWAKSTEGIDKCPSKIKSWIPNTQKAQQKPRFTFLTLTITSKQIGNDSAFTKLLNTFFTYGRKYWALKNYLYVLEKQTKTTGNIHAHVLIDKPLPVTKLNYIWCKILGSAGYTFIQTDKNTGETKTLNVFEAMQKYRQSLNDNNSPKYTSPNPADIEYIYNFKAVQKYITKYITKNDTKIYTTIWNCSQSISRLWVGAKISALRYYAHLSEQVHTKIRVKLDDAQYLNICLLKFYTNIQTEIFQKVNIQHLI